MTRKQQIKYLSEGKMWLEFAMEWYDQAEQWEKYLQVAVIFCAYDELLKKKLKEIEK